LKGGVISIKKAWQSYNSRDRLLGPTKNKKERVVPFPPIVQNVIREYVKDNVKGSGNDDSFLFIGKKGQVFNANWLRYHLDKWLIKAGIDKGGRRIVPHSCRSSLALLLSNHHEPLINIQNLLDHKTLTTTKRHYLPTKTDIKSITAKIGGISF
jgi:site-specific recombinase XerD